MISFFVPGICKPGGSKTAFINKKTGRAIIVDACKGNKDWRQDCKVFARQEYKGPPLDGPLVLDVVFYMLRPKGHFGSGSKATTLKLSAPAYPTGKPDCTKLLRALEDSLTGLLWRDDSQIVMQRAQKKYAGYVGGPGAQVHVWGVDEK